MELTRENIMTIARLARLRLSEERIESARHDLNHILGWIDMLNELNVDKVDPMFSVFIDQMPRRQDVVTDGNIADDIMANAPGEPMFNMFEVPKVVE